MSQNEYKYDLLVKFIPFYISVEKNIFLKTKNSKIANHLMSFCVVLDLDETIISSTSLRPPAEHFLKVKIPSIRRYLYVQFRPGLKDFFKEMSKNGIDIFIFTSEPKKVANPIIDALALKLFSTSHSNPNNKIDEKDRNISNTTNCISQIIPQNHRLFREDCIIENGYYVKDLNIINNMKTEHFYPINNIILVDDMQGNAQRQPQNLIKIKPWYGNEENDNELLGYVLPQILNRINGNTKENIANDRINSSITNEIIVKAVDQAAYNDMSVI